ncbi:MAG: hypothetical protein WBC18_15395 [Ottowia sp.]|uniref:hypothetical protein n=1 Tax=Ottowia sp. TaxID=1898956 RepID=UPI003C776538
MTSLWPPLSQIRAELLGEASPSAEAPLLRHDEAPSPLRAPNHPEALLVDLAHRRQAARAYFAEQPWEPGCVVLVRQGHAHVGVLLDRQDAPGALWHGWMTSAEPDWAGWHDVLLEPSDEPADPSASVVQAWNRVRLPEQAQTSAVLARLSPARLAAMRAVWAESLDPQRPNAGTAVEPAPGHVALRETQDGHTVLTGTPLGANDPRLEHQALYRDLGQRLIAAAQPATPAPRAALSPPSTPSWWSRLRSALRPDGLLRPAFALLAVVAVAQQWMIWQGSEEDEVRFRSLPPAPPSVVVRWQPTARVDEAQALLKSLPAGPDTSILPDGRWLIEVNDPATARARLSASPLVQMVEEP